jgi:HKD family nuclease
MATKDFLLQGFTARTHLIAVRRLFEMPDLSKAILSVAFVTADGVNLLADDLKKHATKVTIFAGIRNDITSHQGLARLLDLGVTVHVVDTGSRNVLFHPKLFVARSAKAARFVIGSANLTIGGLNNNIEAGLAIDCDLSIAGDKAVVDAIETQLAQLPKDFPDHVLAVSTAKDLAALLESGRLVDETAVPPPRPATSSKAPTGDTVTRIKLKVPPIRSAFTRARTVAPKHKPRQAAGAAVQPAPQPATIGVEYELMWESKDLTERDLNVPTGATTNPTGSINLDKGQMADDVDHRHYFREDVFPDLSWGATNRPTVEEAHAKFQLVLKGISYGDYDLRIAHTKGTTSKAYLQRNAMTRLSWGPMRDLVGRRDLIGRTLRLYRDKADPTRFVLEID